MVISGVVRHFFTLDAASFLISALMIGLIGDVPVRAPHARVASRRMLGRGFGAMRQHRLLGFLLTTSGLNYGAWYAAMFLGLPLILAGGSQSSAGGLRIFGAVIACYGAANLVMNIVVGNRTLPPFSRRLILWGIMLNGAGIMLIGLAALASVPMPLIYAGAALAGGGGPMNDIPRSTLMQTAVPAGDVTAAFRAWMIMANAGVVLAMAAAPVVFTVAGPGVGVALCGAMIAGAGLWGMGQRTLRRM